MTKFGFRIRTRSGTPVDNLVIHARDQEEAERKLRQMYMNCEILECHAMDAPGGDESPDLEGFISLIGKQEREPR